MANQSLKDLAKKAKDQIDDKDTENNITETSNDEVSEAPIIIAAPTKKKNIRKVHIDEEVTEKDQTQEDPDLVTPTVNGVTSNKITDDDLRTVMPDLSDTDFASSAKKMKASLSQYRKNLIINNGFTPEEADSAVRSKMNKDGKEINDQYLEENPNVGIVEIDKKNEDEVKFTPEEKEKLTKSKAIKLVVVENKDLESLKIKKLDKKHKATYLKAVEGGLSKYSLPLPVMGDFVTFKGAQTIQLISTTQYEDDHIEDMISKKASLIYNRMIGGTIFKKFDDNGAAVNMTYDEFVNNFKFHDINLAMYGILVASSMEDAEVPLTCPECNGEFNWKYNIKGLLKMDNISDKFKEMIDNILGGRNDSDLLQSIHDKNFEVTRYKSPFTNNIYDVNYPSIARSINMFSKIKDNDEARAYISAIAMFLQSMFIYDKESDSYIEIDDDDPEIIIETAQSLPQKDINLLFTQIAEMLYEPEFIMESKCPNCGKKLINKFSIDQLIFLSAQDTGTEIR